MVVWQLGVSLLVAALFLIKAWQSALGALMGGVIVMLGTALMAWRVFGGGHADAGATLRRVLFGMAMKWAVVGVGFYVLVAHWRLPPLPVLAGVIAALIVYVASLRLKI